MDGVNDITTLGLGLDSTAIDDGNVALDRFRESAESAAASADRFADSSDSVARASEAQVASAQRLSSALDAYDQELANRTKREQEAAAEGDRFIDRLARQAAALDANRESTLRMQIASAQLTAAQRETANAYADYIAATERAAAADKFIDQLRQQAEAIGKTRDELLQLKIAQADLTEGQRSQATAYAAAIKAHEDSAAATRSDAEAQRSLSDFLEGIGIRLPRITAGFVGTTAAIVGMVEVTRESIAAFAEAEKVQIRLETMIETTGKVASVSAESISAFAQAMQKSTTFDDESIKSAATSLLKFSSVGGENIERVTRLSADLAAVMGTDVTHAAELVGRSLENAYGAMMLRRMGLLTDAQVDYARELRKSGDDVGAMEFLLTSLEARAGGAAEMIGGRGLAAAEAELHNQTHELTEQFGEFMARVLGTEERTRSLTGIMAALNDALAHTNELAKNTPTIRVLNAQALPSIGVEGYEAPQQAASYESPLAMGPPAPKQTVEQEAQAASNAKAIKEWEQALRDADAAHKSLMTSEQKLDEFMTRSAAGWKAMTEAAAKSGDANGEAMRKLNDYILRYGTLEGMQAEYAASLALKLPAAKGETEQQAYAILKAASDARIVDIRREGDEDHRVTEQMVKDAQTYAQIGVITQRDAINTISSMREDALQRDIERDDRQITELGQRYAELEKMRTPQNKATVDKQEADINRQLVTIYNDQKVKLDQIVAVGQDRVRQSMVLDNAESLRLAKMEDQYQKQVDQLARESEDRQFQATLIGQSAEAQARLTAEHQKDAEITSMAVGWWQQMLDIIRQEGPENAKNNVYYQQAEQNLLRIVGLREQSVKAAGDEASAQQRIAEFVRNVYGALQQVTGLFSTFFTDLLSKGQESFHNLWENFKRMAIAAIAEVAAKQLVINVAMAVGLGGAATNALAGGGSGAGGILNSLLFGKNVASGAEWLTKAFSGGSSTPSWLQSLVGGGGGGSSAGVVGQYGVPFGTEAAGGWAAGESLASSGAGWVSGMDLLAEGGSSVAASSSIGSLMTSLAPALPWLSIAAIAAPFIISAFSKKSGPMERAFGLTKGTDLSEFQDVSEAHKLVGTDAQQTSAYNKTVDDARKSYADSVRLLGGTVKDFSAIVYSSADPKGTAQSSVHVAAKLGGQSVFNTDLNQTLGRDPQAIADAISLNTQRAVFAAIQKSDLPDKVGALLGKFSAETLSEDEINSVMTIATAWAALIKNLGDKIPEAVNKLFAAFDPAAMDTNTAEQLTNFAVAYADVADVLSRNPMDDALKSIGTAWEQAYDVFTEQGKAIADMASSYDGTAEASASLTAATNQYYSSLVKLLAQVQQVKQSVDSMFTNAIRTYQFAGMDKSQQQIWYKQDAANAEQQLKTAKDANTIQQATARILQDQQAQWNLLSPQQQAMMWRQFASEAERVQAVADARLVEIGQQLQSEFDTYMEGVKSVLDDAANKFLQAANKIDSAAGKIGGSGAANNTNNNTTNTTINSSSVFSSVRSGGNVMLTPAPVGGGGRSGVNVTGGG